MDYIASPQWKRIREAKIKQAGGKCERCGRSKFSGPLEAHHKDYRHFKHERLEDLELLCARCHGEADIEREVNKDESRDNSPLAVGFENWMDHNDRMKGWRYYDSYKLESHWNDFIRYISKVSKKDYRNIQFKRLDRWHGPEQAVDWDKLDMGGPF